MRKSFHSRIHFLYISLSLICNHAFTQSTSEKDDKKVTQILSVMDSVFTSIDQFYVEDVELEKLMRRGIDAMFNSLDPFTYFMSKEEVEEFEMNLSGRFGGAGMFIRDIDQEIFIGHVFRGRPADKAGLRPADVIIEIEGMTTKGMNIYEVLPKLRGTPGSTLNMQVKRVGMSSPISVKIIREEIKVSAVPYSGIINNVGYIRLAFVTENCSEEVLNAFKSLKSKQQLDGIVIDLRDNTGGYFKEAIKLSNIFLAQGTPLVRVKGKTGDSTYYAPGSAFDTNIPLVILTNNNTASAAEVFSGAIQDLDRGLIVGQKTFGKGLVGKPFNMVAGTKAVITISYYYTPSGRCIQSRNYPGMEKSIILPTANQQNFATKNGRRVLDRQGILPDVPVQANAEAPIALCLSDSNFIFKWASLYKQKHPSIADLNDFRLTDEEYNQFVNWFKPKGCAYATETESKLLELEEKTKKEGYISSIQPELDAFKFKLNENKKQDLIRYKNQIRGLLEEEIASRYHYEEGRSQVRLKDDVVMKKAIEIIQQKVKYKKLLGVK